MQEKPQRSVALTIHKTVGDEWILELSNKRVTDRYYDAAAALRVAAVEILSARKRGLKADFCVQDDYGDVHLCTLIDRPDGTEHCLACESSWAEISRPLPPRCPLWQALGDRKPAGL